MESFGVILTTMLLVLALIAVGFFCRKGKYTNDTFDGMFSKIILNVALPAMILNSVLKNDHLPDADTVWMLFGVSTVFFVILSVLALVVVKVIFAGAPKNSQGVYAFTIAFGNTGFIGFPIVGALFGPDAILYGAIYNIPYNVFMFSVGLLMISMNDTPAGEGPSKIEQAKGILRSLVSPTNASCLAAIVLVLLQVTDQGLIGQFCSTMGAMVAPGALLIVGSTLAKMPFKRMFNDARAFIAAGIRLLVVPLLFFFGAGFIITDPLMLGSITILAGTPVATVGTILCIAHRGDLEAMSKCTFLTTVFMLVTIPILALIVL